MFCSYIIWMKLKAGHCWMWPPTFSLNPTPLNRAKQKPDNQKLFVVARFVSETKQKKPLVVWFLLCIHPSRHPRKPISLSLRSLSHESWEVEKSALSRPTCGEKPSQWNLFSHKVACWRNTDQPTERAGSILTINLKDLLIAVAALLWFGIVCVICLLFVIIDCLCFSHCVFLDAHTLLHCSIWLAHWGHPTTNNLGDRTFYF